MLECIGCFKSLSVLKIFNALSNSPHFDRVINSYCNLAGGGVPPVTAAVSLAAEV